LKGESQLMINEKQISKGGKNKSLAVDPYVHHEYKKLAAYTNRTAKDLLEIGLELLKEKYNYRDYGNMD
jgi:hypothetical protein